MSGFTVRVLVEEPVYAFTPPANGSGPTWCRGNTCIVRVGEDLLASGMETIPGAMPLNNCLPLLFRRTASGWTETYRQERRTREPSPLACFHDGRVFLSLNPTLTPDDAHEGPSEPQVARFSGAGAPRILLPRWRDNTQFTEHSYRSFVADGARGELVLFQNVGMSHAAFSFLDGTGTWASWGNLVWPWGAEYEQPQPVRVCYPSVALRDRAVYFCGVSDIEEPNPAWRAFKRKLTGREWDYDFRRLFFTWSDDITTGRFHAWTELASRERTCGWIFPCDMHIDSAATVHLLWLERAIDERLRDTFFPGERQSHCLHYAVVKDGVVLFRRVIAMAGETGERPGNARFQAAPDGRLFILYYAAEEAGPGRNLVREIVGDRGLTEPRDAGLRFPLAEFFTATPRAGCKPSNRIDILGEVGTTMRYAALLIE